MTRRKTLNRTRKSPQSKVFRQFLLKVSSCFFVENKWHRWAQVSTCDDEIGFPTGAKTLKQFREGDEGNRSHIFLCPPN